MNQQTNSIECFLHDISLPDYWQGSSKMVVAVPLFSGMTLKEFQNEFYHQFNLCDYSYELNEIGGENANAFDAFNDQFIDGKDLTTIVYEQSFPDDYSEEDEDSMDTVYAYIAFQKAE